MSILQDDSVTIEMRLNIQERHLISAFQVHQKEIDADIQRAVEDAVKNFNFYEKVKSETNKILQQFVSDFIWRGQGNDFVEKHTRKIMEQAMEKYMAKWSEEHGL